jgi:hypothetical protein
MEFESLRDSVYIGKFYFGGKNGTMKKEVEAMFLWEGKM